MWLLFCLCIPFVVYGGSDFFLGEKHEYGFVSIDNSLPQYKLFYWLFRSRISVQNPPLIIWIEGGPGCSSEQAAFMEHGPYRILHGSKKFISNPFSWNNDADLLFFDQPLGTGLSNCSDVWRIPKTTEQTAEDFYGFFLNFLSLHPEYTPQATKLIFAGHSYAGHFLPAIVSLLLKRKFPYQIAASIMGNPYINPEAVLWSYPRFAYNNNLIDSFTYLAGIIAEKLYNLFFELKLKETAYTFYNLVESIVIGFQTPHFLPYDIRGVVIPFEDFETLMKDRILKEMGLEDRKWENCNWLISSQIMALDQLHDYSMYVEELIQKNQTVVFYYGVHDFVCNTLSWEKTLENIWWTGKSEFQKEPMREFWANGKIKGTYKNYKNVWLVHAFNAGHIVFYNEPEFGYDLITRIIKS